jgi:hypothetical protein
MPRRKPKPPNHLDPSPHYRCGAMPRTAPDAFKSQDDDMLAALEPFMGRWASGFLAKARETNLTVAGLYDRLRFNRIAPDDAEAICSIYKASRVTPRPRLLEEGRGPRSKSAISRIPSCDPAHSSGNPRAPDLLL